jgi:hypothetical protein
MRSSFSSAVHGLCLLTLALQLCDGLATAQGLRLGVSEANPLVRESIAHWGRGWALLGWKTLACALLVFLRIMHRHPLAVAAVSLTVAVSGACSALPWLWLLVSWP